MCREALRDAAVHAHPPEIPLGGKHERVTMNGRVAVVAKGGRIRCGSWMRERNRRENRDDEAEGKMFVHRSGILTPKAGSKDPARHAFVALDALVGRHGSVAYTAL